MNPTTVILFKDHSRYDMLAHFADAAAQGLLEAGCRVLPVHFRSPSVHHDLQQALQQRPSFALAFNAIGYDIKDADGRSIYDTFRIPLYAFLVDHPMYHMIRLNEPVQNRRIFCVDPSHLRFMSACYPDDKASCIPHGGLPSTDPLPDFSTRDIPLLFCGSCYDPASHQKELQSLPEKPRRFLQDIQDECLANPTRALWDVAFEHLASLHGNPPPRVSRELTRALIRLDQVLIAHRRNQLLTAIQHAGLPLHIYGHHWEQTPYNNVPHFHIHPALDCSAMLHLLRRTRVALNMVPSFPSGTHERVFTAMLHGAVSLTQTGTLIETLFHDGRDILLYDWKNPEAAIERLQPVLNDPHALSRIAHAGTLAAQPHTWAQRAQRILESC